MAILNIVATQAAWLRGSRNVSFSVLRASAGAQVFAGTSYAFLGTETSTNIFADLRRGVYTFDLSSIPSGVTVTGVKFKVTGKGKVNTLGTTDFNVCAATPADWTSLVAADYTAIGRTLLGSLAYASYLTDEVSDNNEVSLNATGLAYVIAAISAGNVSFSAQVDADLNNVEPTWGSNQSSQFTLDGIPDTGKEPKLEITYSLPTPTVTTTAISDLTATKASTGGNVTDDGGSPVTERGVVLGRSVDPTISDTKYTTTGTTGAYTIDLTALEPLTTYHVRAFATSDDGTGYGADVAFTTGAYIRVPIGATADVPAGYSLLSTNTAGNWHNNSENYISQPAESELFDADEGIKFWYGADITDTVVDTTEYIIISQATFDFTTVGAASNDLGTVFTATGGGTLGTGDLIRATQDATPRAIYYENIQADVYDYFPFHQIFANTETNKRRDIATYSVEQTGADLDTIYKVIDDTILRDSNGDPILDEDGNIITI